MFGKTIIVGLILSSTTSFAIGWIKVAGVGKASQKGIITVTADWLKDKDNKFDVSMHFTNETDKTILLFVGDMKCARGPDKDGNIDNHTDRRTIDLRGHESRSVVVTCRLPSETKGDFSVAMKVYENPSSDSNTPGKILAEALTWKQGENEGKPLK